MLIQRVSTLLPDTLYLTSLGGRQLGFLQSLLQFLDTYLCTFVPLQVHLQDRFSLE